MKPKKRPAIKSKASQSKKKQGASAGRKRVDFSLKAAPSSEVRVAGTFNQWDQGGPLMKEIAPGHFQRIMYLPKARYEYKFIVNGEWIADPECANQTPNEVGTLNSVLELNH